MSAHVAGEDVEAHLRARTAPMEAREQQRSTRTRRVMKNPMFRRYRTRSLVMAGSSARCGAPTGSVIPIPPSNGANWRPTAPRRRASMRPWLRAYESTIW